MYKDDIEDGLELVQERAQEARRENVPYGDYKGSVKFPISLGRSIREGVIRTIKNVCRLHNVRYSVMEVSGFLTSAYLIEMKGDVRDLCEVMERLVPYFKMLEGPKYEPAPATASSSSTGAFQTLGILAILTIIIFGISKAPISCGTPEDTNAHRTPSISSENPSTTKQD